MFLHHFLFLRILNPQCVLMKSLGKDVPFESVVGLNGRVWVKTRSVKETIAVVNAIQAAENMTNDQIKFMCTRLMDSLAGFSPEEMET